MVSLLFVRVFPVHVSEYIVLNMLVSCESMCLMYVDKFDYQQALPHSDSFLKFFTLNKNASVVTVGDRAYV